MLLQANSKPIAEKLVVRNQAGSAEATKESTNEKLVPKVSPPRQQQELQTAVKPDQSSSDKDALQQKPVANEPKSVSKPSDKKSLKRAAEAVPSHPAKRKPSNPVPDGSITNQPPSDGNGLDSVPVVEEKQSTQKGFFLLYLKKKLKIVQLK